jgi:epoxyqueuosine reductase
VPVLVEALSDAEPLVRRHAAWALGEIGSEIGLSALATRVAQEEDDSVRVELCAALRPNTRRHASPGGPDQ